MYGCIFVVNKTLILSFVQNVGLESSTIHSTETVGAELCNIKIFRQVIGYMVPVLEHNGDYIIQLGFILRPNTWCIFRSFFFLFFFLRCCIFVISGFSKPITHTVSHFLNIPVDTIDVFFSLLLLSACSKEIIGFLSNIL